MAGGIDVREVKRLILELLEEDREFRYTMMGFLGFREILERITRLEERQQRLEERQQKLEERFASLEERFQKLEERFAKLEERFARLEEEFLELRKSQQRLEQAYLRLEERMEDLRRVMLTVAHRFGVLSHEAFREAMRYVVEEVLGAGRVERWVYRDEEGYVYGHPAIVEVDVLIRDREHILVEVKSRVSKADVAEMRRIGELYEKVEKTKPRLVIVGGFIDRDAYELARRTGVQIVPIITPSEW